MEPVDPRLRPRNMVNRRQLLALTGLAALGGSSVLAGCGSTNSKRPSSTGSTRGSASSNRTVQMDSPLVRSEAALAAIDHSAVQAVAPAVAAFTADLFGRIATGSTGNLVCSPYSAAVALAMTVQGARGDTAAQMLKVLHGGTGADAAVDLATGLGGLDRTLATRAGTRQDGNGHSVQVQLQAANSLWGQRHEAWCEDFLDVLAADFGAGLHQVDYTSDVEGARKAINAWVSGQTNAKIPELIAPGVLDQMTRLVLANALYLKAPWQDPFLTMDTAPAPFTRPDGSKVTVRMMNRPDGVLNRAQGDGWTAVDLPYAGSELAMAVILPDAGRFARVQTGFTADFLKTVLTGMKATPLALGLPRWKTRTQTPLSKVLAQAGMPLAFSNGADFSGMTAQDALKIGAVLHEGYIAVDEAGTEAAAATAVVMKVMGIRADPPASLVVDRPFFYVIHDVATETPLFVGRVVDPTVAAV